MPLLVFLECLLLAEVCCSGLFCSVLFFREAELKGLVTVLKKGGTPVTPGLDMGAGWMRKMFMETGTASSPCPQTTLQPDRLTEARLQLLQGLLFFLIDLERVRASEREGGRHRFAVPPIHALLG